MVSGSPHLYLHSRRGYVYVRLGKWYVGVFVVIDAFCHGVFNQSFSEET